MWMLSCLFLAFVALMCVVGALSSAYEDNLLQRIGLAVLCLGCAARVEALLQTQQVHNDWFLVHGGLALFAGGTLWKVVHRK